MVVFFSMSDSSAYKTGWSVLNIETNHPAVSKDEEQADYTTAAAAAAAAAVLMKHPGG